MNDEERLNKYKKGWCGGQPETPCGWGSQLEVTKAQRKWIPQIVKKYGIKTIADIGAGDLNWISKVKFPVGVKYTPYDLVPRKPDVVEFDLLYSAPPKVDMLMCLWVLNHFPRDECEKAIDNILYSGAKFLLMTYRPQYAPDLPEIHEALHGDAVESMQISDDPECYLELINLNAGAVE